MLVVLLNSESMRHILNSPSPEQTRAGARKRDQQETSATNLQSDPESAYMPKTHTLKVDINGSAVEEI